MRTTRVQQSSVVGSAQAELGLLKKWGGWAAFGLLVLLVIIPLWRWRTSPSTTSESHVAAQSVPVIQPVMNADSRLGRKIRYRFEITEPSVPFNPAGEYAPNLWHEGHCIMIRQALSKTAQRHCSGHMPPDVESAWSADGVAFDGFYRLSPPRYEQIVRWR